jgi:hypothetical protein
MGPVTGRRQPVQEIQSRHEIWLSKGHRHINKAGKQEK